MGFVEFAEGTVGGEVTEGEGGGMVADEVVTEVGGGAGDAGCVGKGDNEEATIVKGLLKVVGEVFVQPASKDKDDRTLASQKDIEDSTFQFAMKRADDWGVTLGDLHCPIQTRQYGSALCLAGTEKAYYRPVKDGDVSKCCH